MANRRMISKTISTSKKLSRISLLAKVIYTWLIPHTDDFGRMDGDVESIKAIVIPREKVSMGELQKALDELKKHELLHFYEIEGETYCEVINFDDHQTFKSDRPRRSLYPSPNGSRRNSEDSNRKPEDSNVPRKLSKVKLSKERGNKLPWHKKIEKKDPEYKKVILDLVEQDYLGGTALHNIILQEFIPHWREKSGRKERWEKEKTFEYKARIRTWIRNSHKFQKDYQCKEKMWHRSGESCHCKKDVEKQQVEIKNGVAHVAKKMKV